jgi:hypothetical protein
MVQMGANSCSFPVPDDVPEVFQGIIAVRCFARSAGFLVVFLLETVGLQGFSPVAFELRLASLEATNPLVPVHALSSASCCTVELAVI